MASGTAFGEWGLDQLGEEVGFVPAGLARMADLWQYAPLSDYRIAGFDASFMQAAAGYIISALVGVALVAGIMSLLRKVVKE
ncbi:MAG: cobalamin biosynthesis protein [Firmicutes bacterium]|nr:cobalamin biosynthesis protein [Bacillota bacterium]